MASNSRDAITPPREMLTKYLARLYDHRLTTTTGGNISIIDNDGIFYITPSGGDKAIVPPEKIAIRRPHRTEFEGLAPPSMEWPLHTAAYEAKPEARAVLHAHSPTLVAFSVAEASDDIKDGVTAAPDGEKEVEPDEEEEEECRHDPRTPNTKCLMGAWGSCGKVALAKYSLPGSQNLAEVCRESFLSGANCVILQNHGVVVVGKTLHQAYDRFVALEYLAQSIVNAQPLGLPLKNISPKMLHYVTHPEEPSGDNPFYLKSIPSRYEKERIVTGEEKQQRAELCKFVHRAYNQNLIVSESGSFSVRMTNGGDVSFLITPTQVDRHFLEAADICYIGSSFKKATTTATTEDRSSESKCDNGHKKIKGLYHSPIHHPSSDDSVTPSRAAWIHETIFKTHPSINCVMICQPPHATAFCVTGARFNSSGIPESYIVLHDITTVSLEEALKDDGRYLAEQCLDPAKGKNTVLVQGYGIITVGENLLKTFVQVEVLESMCCVMLKGMCRGKVALLSKEQTNEVREAFHSH